MNDTGTTRPVYAIIMAGGRGTRFWPLGRERKPKHLLPLLDGRSLLQETWSRLTPLVAPERILVVTAARQAREVARQLPQIPPENIIREPVGKNTAACVGLGALHIQRRSPAAIILALPADQLIRDVKAFQLSLRVAIRAAAAAEALVTIGVTPRAPETGYGYIQKGEMITHYEGEPVFRVRSFREKPSRERAEKYLAGGDHYWNGGIFIGRLEVINKAFATHLPPLAQALAAMAPFLGKKGEMKAVAQGYEQLPALSLDVGVLEKHRDTLVVPGHFDWQDLGSWDAFWELKDKDQRGNSLSVKDGLVMDAADSLVLSPHKLVVLIGVEDLLVVDTKDALLICRRGRSQEVGLVPGHLRESGKKNYL
jgi:mannose-1-phosphate guanylyltransferase